MLISWSRQILIRSLTCQKELQKWMMASIRGFWLISWRGDLKVWIETSDFFNWRAKLPKDGSAAITFQDSISWLCWIRSRKITCPPPKKSPYWSTKRMFRLFDSSWRYTSKCFSGNDNEKSWRFSKYNRPSYNLYSSSRFQKQITHFSTSNVKNNWSIQATKS